MMFEEFSRRMLESTQTGFDRHPTGKQYHGFTCPECGGHTFSTSTFPNGISVGYCTNTRYHVPAAPCTFSWDRNNEKDEANAFYNMSYEEYQSFFNI